jgi:hypothetical protein
VTLTFLFSGAACLLPMDPRCDAVVALIPVLAEQAESHECLVVITWRSGLSDVAPAS